MIVKYLLLFALLALAFWLWRRARRDASRNSRPPAVPPDKPQAMLRCAHCGLHLPAADAVSGKRGDYCSVAHRQLAES